MIKRGIADGKKAYEERKCHKEKIPNELDRRKSL